MTCHRVASLKHKMLWLAVFLLFVRTSVSVDWNPMVMNENMPTPLRVPTLHFSDTFKRKVEVGLSAKEVFVKKPTEKKIVILKDILNIMETPWGPWSDFDTCTKTCGNGTKTRTKHRACKRTTTDLGDVCIKNRDTESVACNSEPCTTSVTGSQKVGEKNTHYESIVTGDHVDGNWGTWGTRTYGNCSTSCGSGERKYTRQRVCNNPKPSGFGKDCVGESVQNGNVSCEIQPCPVDGQWGAWGGRHYKPCSVTCGNGTREYTETRSCCNPSPEFGGKACPGVRERVGSVIGCDVAPCSVDGVWTAWSHADVGPCSVSCNGGVRNLTLVRSCDNPPPQNGGQKCSGAHSWSTVMSGCNPQSCNMSLVNEKVYVADCSDIIEHYITTSGVFTIQPRDFGLPLRAYCDIEDKETAWLVIQRKSNGSLNFNKTWNEYRDGFGEIDSDYWLGNNDIHRITQQGQYELQIDLETNTAERKHVTYDTFYVASEKSNFELKVIGFHGDIKDSLSPSNGMRFVTYDMGRYFNCDDPEVSGFWIINCFSLNMGKDNKVTWPPWCKDTCYITSSVMKIRRRRT
ncbi:uncharacterized protein LOC121386672 [Gigantopelta aegis]|uniref:uncharacterized protein LOC121386672 n=1 Tax=Gigantopelta aegis TaxID=1735272 RepID=UPI001B88B0A3|nr:uncharacterized protein LOC121386672 [Gigantopelta aegis]